MGNSKYAHVWVLQCNDCRNVYGANGCDFHIRHCPKCQDGQAGLAVPTDRDGLVWNREEHLLVFELYNRTPFGKMHRSNPDVVRLAAILGRSANSVAYKLSNFARLDPSLQARGIKGMSHGAKGEVEIWQEFRLNPDLLITESSQVLARRTGIEIPQLLEICDGELPPPGEEREALVRLRLKQSYFRNRVLSAYNESCCITGLRTRPLLVASHIVPWSEDPAQRLNPRNGLCLNALHDKAFDRGLIWIESDFVVKLSPRLDDDFVAPKTTIEWLRSFGGQPLRLPEKFSPDPELLRRHADRWRTSAHSR